MGLFDTLNKLGDAAKVTLLGVATLAWLGATIATAVVRRSILVAGATFIAGGLLVAAMWNSDWIRDRSQHDITGTGAPAAVVIEAPWPSTSS